MFKHALIVEDEPHLASTLEIALGKLQITCTLVESLEGALTWLQSKALTHYPDLILLDRQLPDGDGLTLCRTLRERGVKSSILCLTASGDTQSRVEGLNAGADDYLPKPFSWDELAARIQALSRRYSPLDTVDTLWKLEVDRLRIHGPKGWVQLTPLEYKLATRLMEAEGKILTREELLRSVWGFHFLTKTRTVDLFLGRLRKYFELDPESPQYFVTVRGAGYVFKRTP